MNSRGERGERHVLKRSIEPEAIGPSIGERIFSSSKHLCIVLAGGAITISALDLMNVGSVQAAAEFIHANKSRIADLPDAMLGSFQLASVSGEETHSVTVAIPRELFPSMNVAKSADRVLPVPAAKSGSAAVAELVSVRQQDAVEFAMVSSHALAAPRGVAPIQLASADAGAMTTGSLPLPAIQI